ncbi:MAG: hypothetical protein HDQ88_00755 [Clostridia bacterium]|nr:hypothetical protein [Clostridia bacterium]
MRNQEMMNKIANNEKAMEMFGKIISFEPVSKTIAIKAAAKEVKAIVDYDFLHKVQHAINTWEDVNEPLEEKMTSKDMIEVNSILRSIESITALKEGKIVGPMEISRTILMLGKKDESGEEIAAQMVENFPDQVVMIAMGLSGVITKTVEEFMGDRITFGSKLDFINKFFHNVYDIPVEAYEALIGMTLNEQIEDIAMDAAMSVWDEITEEGLMKIELNAKKEILKKYESIDPNSRKNRKALREFEEGFNATFNEETLKNLLTFMMKPANETMEAAIKKMKKLEAKEVEKNLPTKKEEEAQKKEEEDEDENPYL